MGDKIREKHPEYTVISAYYEPNFEPIAPIVGYILFKFEDTYYLAIRSAV